MPYIDNDEHNTTAEPGNLDLARSLLGQGNTHVESVLKSPVPYFHCPRLIRRPAGPRTPWGLENRSEEQSTDRPHKHERAAAPQRDGERPHRRTPILPAPLEDQSGLARKCQSSLPMATTVASLFTLLQPQARRSRGASTSRRAPESTRT